MSKYWVKVRIGKEVYEHASDAELKLLFKSANCVSGCGRRNGFRTVFEVTDYLTGMRVFRTYSLKTPNCGWKGRVARGGRITEGYSI